MADVLAEIVARKREDVAARLGGASLADLRGRAQPTRRSLKAALTQRGVRFVMEVKRKSPSEGTFRPGADPAAMARAYRGAADAVSVLTDTPFFGGSLADLAAVRAAYEGPILAKDFVVDPRQVPEARLHGADAALVMLSVLDDEDAAIVIREAELLAMDVLVEAHDEDEVRRAVALGAPVVGINNRNLRTLKIDLGVTERLAHLVPADRILVAESGIGERANVERLSPRADAFLVGSSLMRAAVPARAARRLAFGRVKVCALTGADDARRAAAAGASYVGIVLVPGTPRAVNLEAAEAVAEAAREEGAAVVGVFRNSKVVEVAHAARALALDAVQLHGREDGAYIGALRNLLPVGTEIWAAAPVGRDEPPHRPCADRTLFDTEVDGQSGGTGIAFDWSRLEGREDVGRGVLAGGLGAHNASAAARVGAFALDVGSGVEAAPGRKDPDKLRAFFEALRPPARGEAQPCA
ncbi:MAG: bifunctional indole-3-glycerol-phosphate synthase TrpC/phosphoribosylanthranilate isomerase TrpF [Sphingosinicella sp.]|uniref:bifunctional indole-3-glycerol-phosphate synthase TrpC/phosphoribosylanthranilate isomerase TrpF n=1 Tax=Sphingosinicella sp. TaxID=1917971 RepID=UPI004038367E